MEISGAALGRRMLNAAAAIKAAKAELTAIDSRFGDGDHGVTMERIADCVERQARTWQDGTELREAAEALGDAVMGISGGSAAPLWGTFLGGLAMGIPAGATALSAAELRAMFQSALDEMYEITTARVGDKTMMDTLIPAAEAIISGAAADGAALLDAARQAAQAGAKASESFVAKFGRAKSYREQTIGTPDAGAVSMQRFFEGFCQ